MRHRDESRRQSLYLCTWFKTLLGLNKNQVCAVVLGYKLNSLADHSPAGWGRTDSPKTSSAFSHYCLPRGSCVATTVHGKSTKGINLALLRKHQLANSGSGTLPTWGAQFSRQSQGGEKGHWVHSTSEVGTQACEDTKWGRTSTETYFISW
jgi:hypothetical protein